QLINPIIAVQKTNGRFQMLFSGPVTAESINGKSMTLSGITIVISVATTGSKYLYIWYNPRKYQSDKMGSGVTSGFERAPMAAGRTVATTTSIIVMMVRLS